MLLMLAGWEDCKIIQLAITAWTMCVDNIVLHVNQAFFTISSETKSIAYVA